MRNKAQVWVLEAMKLLLQRSPFPWLGMASDNGSEFINKHLLRFCEQEKITFSRTRPSRKNDNPYVEQKNYRWFGGRWVMLATRESENWNW